MSLTGWTPRARPRHTVQRGLYTRLEPLDPDTHGDDLFAAATAGDADARHRYLPDTVPDDRATFDTWLGWAATSAIRCSSP